MSGTRDISVSRPRLGREIMRWGLAAAVVVAGHAGVTYGVSAWGVSSPPNAIEESMVVELAPLSISTPETVESETAQEERPEVVSEIQEDTPAEAEQVVEEQEIEKQTVEEQPQEVEEAPEEVAEDEPVEEVAPTPEVKKAEVVLPRPAKPKPVKKPELRKPKPDAKKVDKPVKKESQTKKPDKPSERASASSQSSAGATAKSRKSDFARWKAQVNAAMSRRQPRSSREKGRVKIRFVVTASGAVTSPGIAQSSGNPALDRAALSMARGRVPTPPPSLGGGPFTFTLPVEVR